MSSDRAIIFFLCAVIAALALCEFWQTYVCHGVTEQDRQVAALVFGWRAVK